MTTSSTTEYISALLKSDRLGRQVTAHRKMDACCPDSVEIPDYFAPSTRTLLDRMGIRTLYAHQLEAITRIRRQRHTVVATPTASGKSLIYNLTFFNDVAVDPEARGLYIFPLKALTQDQAQTFLQWSRAMSGPIIRAAVYDGDTNAYQRGKIRRDPPSVVMTNPEMVHRALLPYHHQWAAFLKHLKLVVIDEVHTYRGFMGSHMCQVLRRFQRICRHYGSCPTFVFSSATLANADQLAGRLTGLDVTVIDQSGAPHGQRHVIMINPLEGPAQTAILLLKAAMARQLRTIVYTQSRKLAELITLWVRHRAGKLAPKIGVYRAGLLPEERRRIERDLRAGKLLAVVSTSALELGIDIGDLDICVLVGYPGSMMATRQRGGRVGRKGQDAAVVFVAGQDALDQYYIRHPEAFFHGRAESVVVNPHNPVVLKDHLVCAAAELPLAVDETWFQKPPVRTALDELTTAGDLMATADGTRIHARKKRPHLEVDLRAAGDRYRIMHNATLLGEINGHRLYFETHPGAVYLHQGRTYRVMSVDHATRTVHADPADIAFYTRAKNDTDVVILETSESKYVGNTKIYYGKLKVTDQILGYERVSTTNGKNLGYQGLNVPPTIFETEGLWCLVDDAVCDHVRNRGHHLLGTLHAAEHATIGIMPLLVLADRNDVGGLATPVHPQIQSAAIFIYDGIPGGGGLTRLAYEHAGRLLITAHETIDTCNCDDGCPACVHSPKCGSGNQPMDKAGGSLLLREMARNRLSLPMKDTQPEPVTPRRPVARRVKPLRYGVFDLETQRSADEVGGWHRAHAMKVSCGVVYDAGDDTYTVYEEDRVPQLIDHLKHLDLVIGFNIKRFDYQVLKGYSDFDFKTLNTLDLLELVHEQLGFRLSLDHLAGQTLNAQKSGSGLDALRWWKQGRMDKIIDYCRKDVKLTRDLYLHARDHGYVIYRNREGERFRLRVQVNAGHPPDNLHNFESER